MSLCYEFQKWTIITLASIALLSTGLIANQIAMADWYDDFLKGYREGEKQQKLDDQTPDKDCPAIQHLHSAICVNNADGKAHGSTFNPNRSSTLDCASNLEMCKMEGLE
jgi:hypothetical protein